MGSNAPGIILWMKVYAFAFLLINGALAILGIWLMVAIDPVIPMLTEEQLALISFRAVGISLCLAAVLFMLLPAVSIFSTDQGWAWAYNLGLLIFGVLFSFLTCLFPIGVACIPLLAGWFSKDVFDYYGVFQPSRRSKRARESELTPPP